jgi:hypothetical protein
VSARRQKNHPDATDSGVAREITACYRRGMMLRSILIALSFGCATAQPAEDAPPDPPPGLYADGMRRPSELETRKKDEPTVPPPAPKQDPCIQLCTDWTAADARCDAAHNACEAKSGYLRSVCQRSCTQEAAQLIGGCEGAPACVDSVAAGESACRASCSSSASNNAECRREATACAKKTAAENALGSCTCS